MLLKCFFVYECYLALSSVDLIVTLLRIRLRGQIGGIMDCG